MSQQAASGLQAAGEAGGGASGRAFVTGGRGFAGSHLVDLLAGRGRPPIAPSREELDLADRPAVREALRQAQPAAVFHMAAFSSPQASWQQPELALLGNMRLTFNVLEAVKAEAPEATVVLVGSGQVYGAGSTPVDETCPFAPPNPYAVSKAAGDMLGQQYAEAHGLRVVRPRPFNHAGPGQSDEYVLSTLARQVAQAERDGRAEAVVHTGDTSSGRDFTDVRDVVRAYELLAGAEPGAYNVCTGRTVTIAELLELLSRHARIPLRAETDPSRLRAHDTRAIAGSHSRLTAATGWRPEIELQQTVGDTLDWWRSRLA